MNITGIILAGGRNSRFPRIKGLLRVGNERIIERDVRLLKEYAAEIIISTNSPEHYFYLGERMIGDLYPSEGPLVGIYSALLNAAYERAFVIACDMPFINGGLIGYICSVNTEAPVVLCSYGGRLHPLFGLYRKDILPLLEQNIKKGLNRLQRVVMDAGPYIVSEEDVKKIDSDGSSFVNINTPEDFEKFTGGKVCLD